jgi:phosphoribosylaminoimidazolecarboxamide formyltransferase/IMP cyclohydrolase
MQQYALLSVSDKSNIDLFARQLIEQGLQIISSGGTAKFLQQQGIEVKLVSDITSHPEILDGRVKTLHPKIHGGILYKRSNGEHIESCKQHDIPNIKVICVNLYPFAKTRANSDNWQDAIENIDIGGPAMIRAAAKNYQDTVVVTSTDDYELALEALIPANITLRAKLAQKAFTHTSYYDNLIQQEFCQKFDLNKLRYGENPHQSAYVQTFADYDNASILTAKQLQGKPLSYNNINDANVAMGLAYSLTEPSCAIIKHATPCGVAKSENNITDAYIKALACDPTSAFGGIIACNREIDANLATALSKIFVEVIIAPSFSEQAQQILSSKKKVRLLATGDATLDTNIMQQKSIYGGILAQKQDDVTHYPDIKCVSTKQVDLKIQHDLVWAMQICKAVKSNAIVLIKDGSTIGIGGGQVSRIRAAEIALENAQRNGFTIKGSLVASDAFFPFADGLEVLTKAGVDYVIQPGGSIRDQEVIDCANDYNVGMLFTGIRHFTH